MTLEPPVESIVALLAALVRIPSRAGEDSPAAVTQRLAAWLTSRGIGHRLTTNEHGGVLAVYAEAGDAGAGGPWIVLNAMLDTAGFGDPAAWTHDPAGAEIADGWLYGRGSADTKAAVSMFAHLFAEFSADAALLGGGRLGVLFDVDEHSGRFTGARSFFGDLAGRGSRLPDGVVIGYPGMDAIVTGGRGFLRARLRVHGIAAHSGASRSRGLNAVDRAIGLAATLSALPLPAPPDAFGLPPELTLTGMQSGGSFSQVPDLCTLELDLRLTPTFVDDQARRLVHRVVTEHDARFSAPPTDIEWMDGWPAFQTDRAHPMVRCLQDAARAELGREVPTKVAGPSNIGNYLATLHVPSICGFGVRSENIHATDERVALASIAPIYRIYRSALSRLLRRESGLR